MLKSSKRLMSSGLKPAIFEEPTDCRLFLNSSESFEVINWTRVNHVFTKMSRERIIGSQIGGVAW
jgi:hypothetical protein